MEKTINFVDSQNTYGYGKGDGYGNDNGYGKVHLCRFLVNANALKKPRRGRIINLVCADCVRVLRD